MKVTASLLALIFVAQFAIGQDTPAPKPNSPSAQTQTAAPANDELITIPASAASKPKATGSTRPEVAPKEEATTVTLWKLIQDGGWAMIPLGVLSIITVMLVLVYLFTLRRSAILTSHYMSTADVLLKKR